MQNSCGYVSIETKSGKPQCQALETLDKVLSWKPSGDHGLFPPGYFSRETCVPPRGSRTQPYTLVCHDFKGGYLEDRYLQGGRKEDAYYFCRWECIDMFIYFSHHFVTVPPVGWVKAAHKHGTLILGTVITEWDDGVEIWSSVLSSMDKVHQLVNKLVAICQCYGLDGWLINVENKIEENKVSVLKEFVELLTEKCHENVPWSKVLWYDSVTRSGELKWQDQLNEQNSLFFDVCDGIFLNYCWTPEKLAASKALALEKQRPFDVFVGIDVFGRGCPGGGGFNTREALQSARDHNLSAAIFAPGWVLETLGKADFDENDCRFWAKLHDLCPQLHGGRLPVASAFCQGHGDAFFSHGQRLTGRQWYNMSLQQRQPERTRVYRMGDPGGLPARPSLNTCLSSAYLGGCSVQLSAHLTRPLQTVSFRLFSVTSKLDEALFCSYTYRKNSDMPCDVFVVLTFGSGLVTRRAVMGCAGEASLQQIVKGSWFKDSMDSDEYTPVSKKSRIDSEAVCVTPLTGEQLQMLKSSVWFHCVEKCDEAQDQPQWITRYFRVDTSKFVPGAERKEEQCVCVSVSLSRPGDAPVLSEERDCEALHDNIERTSVLLGHVQVFRQQDLRLQPPLIKNICLKKLEDTPLITANTESSSGEETRSSTGDTQHPDCTYIVRWQVEGDAMVDYFNVYLNVQGAPSLVGHAALPSFVTSLPAKFVVKDSVVVTVQPVLSATGLPLDLSKCAPQTLFL